MQTPQGIPRWPNDELAAPRTPGTNGAPPEQGWRRWRHALSRAVARQAGASVAVPGGARRWRPPVSGHGTMGLEGEGFGSAATLRESGTQGGQQRDVEPRSRRPEGAGGTAMRSSFIASRRALAGAGGQTVMVPPARAAKHVQFTQQDRTASLPERQRLRSPPPYLPQAQVDFPTGRTAELLQHFPVPPDRASSGAAPPQRPTAAPVAEGARPQVWSLFPPRPSTPVGSKASFSNLQAWLSGRPQSPAQSSTTPTRRKLQKRTQPAPTANATLTPPSDEPSPLASLSTAAPALPPLPFQPRPEGGLLAEHSPERTAISSQDDDDTCDRPAVRGEANARYRYSGTPIYELDAASLRSSDERAEQEGLAEAQLDGARGAEAERNPEDEETRRVGPSVAAGRGGDGVGGSGGNIFPLTPVTLTSHAQVCKHGKPLLPEPRLPCSDQNERQRPLDSAIHLHTLRNLDGGGDSSHQSHTPPPPPLPPTQTILQPSPSHPSLHVSPSQTLPDRQPLTSQPPSPQRTLHLSPSAPALTPVPRPSYAPTTTTTSPAPTQHPRRNTSMTENPQQQQPRRDTFATEETQTHTHASTFRPFPFARAKPTWRTRMQSTRCWRCELHRCHKRGWARVRRALEWTCICRFRAYEEETCCGEELG